MHWFLEIYIQFSDEISNDLILNIVEAILNKLLIKLKLKPVGSVHCGAWKPQ